MRFDPIRADDCAEAVIVDPLTIAAATAASAPRDPAARLLRWREAAAAGRADEAGIAKEAVLLLAGGDPASLAALAREAARLGAFAQAEELFGLAGERAPDLYAALLTRSALRLRAGDAREAAALRRAAATLLPLVAPPGPADAPLILFARGLEAARYELAFDPDHGFRGRFGGGLPIEALLNPRGRRAAMANLLDDEAPLAAASGPALLINAVSCPDRGRPALDAVARFLAARPVLPVVNRPEAVLRAAPDEVARLAARIPGLHVPRQARYARSGDDKALAAWIWRDFARPVLVREEGGEPVLAQTPDALLERLAAAAPGADISVTAFHDTRDAAGVHRKARALLIDGRLHPAALLGAGDWRVRSGKRGATDHDERLRSEERAYLADPARAIGMPRWSALRALCAGTRLDYAGVDFVPTADGVLVLDLSPALGPAGPDSARLSEAFRAMVDRRLADRPR